MKRIIKFRVWDHNLKEFIEDSNADPHICWNGTVYCHERQKEGGDVLVSGIRNLTVPVSYTHLTLPTIYSV